MSAAELAAEMDEASQVPIPRRLLPPREVMALVAQAFDLPVSVMLSERRTKDIAFARQFAMYHCYRGLAQSYPSVGRAFNRDHTTVINACARVAALYASDPTYMEAIERRVFG